MTANPSGRVRGFGLLVLACLFPAAAAGAPRSLERDVVERGDHWRLVTRNGVVHVWRPKGYDPKTAGVVVYVHGYYTSADDAWSDHDLASQFRESRQNALFVVPDAPSGSGENVKWPTVGGLLQTVASTTGLKLPKGPIVLMGHSGGVHTLSRWLNRDRRLTELILLDAVYGSTAAPLRAWLRAGARGAHRLVLVAEETLSRSLALVRGLAGVARRSRIPGNISDFTHRERRARVLLMRSQYGHMELVESGKVIPVVLGLAPLKGL